MSNLKGAPLFSHREVSASNFAFRASCLAKRSHYGQIRDKKEHPSLVYTGPSRFVQISAQPHFALLPHSRRVSRFLSYTFFFSPDFIFDTRFWLHSLPCLVNYRWYATWRFLFHQAKSKRMNSIRGVVHIKSESRTFPLRFFFPVRPQRIELTGVDGPLKEGALVTLTCRVEGARPAPNITWYKNAAPLEAQPDSNIVLMVCIFTLDLRSFQKKSKT